MVFLVIRCDLHFFSLKGRPDANDHVCRLSRSLCRRLQSSSLLTVVNSLVSSANIATWLDVTSSGRSLTYKAGRRGPRIEP